MGMVQSGGGAGFTLKALQSLAVLGKMFRQKLQGDEAAELGVLGLINHTHAAATQLLEDAVMRDRATNHGFETRNWKLRNSDRVRVRVPCATSAQRLLTQDEMPIKNPKSQIHNQRAHVAVTESFRARQRGNRCADQD